LEEVTARNRDVERERLAAEAAEAKAKEEAEAAERAAADEEERLIAQREADTVPAAARPSGLIDAD
jgi:hypothetical protein